MGLLSFVGSVLIASLFLGSGIGKVTDPAGTAGYIKATKFYELAVQNGVPLNEGDNMIKFTIALGALMILGAIMFVLNIARPLAALMLASFVAAITVFVHVNLENPAATTMDNTVHCLKNGAIIGGLLMGAFGGRKAVTNTATSAAAKKKRE